MERNPYTLVFGREPLQVIPRVSIVNEVVETFCEEPPSQQVFLITGVRGSGKTVLMTGLFDNIRRLQDEKTLTFLYRAPRLDMKPLNIGIIADNYRKNLDLDDSEALRMAKMTLGYPFAFQVFGYFAWRYGSLSGRAISECKQYLDDYAYEKIWSELSQGGREVVRAIAEASSSRVRDVRKVAQMSTNQFNPYRNRLVKKSIVDGTTYGHVSFALPLFDRYVMEHS